MDPLQLFILKYKIFLMPTLKCKWCIYIFEHFLGDRNAKKKYLKTTGLCDMLFTSLVFLFSSPNQVQSLKTT